MAAVTLPGSYPDSVPATPDETMRHALQSEQHPRQPSKLHKPGDPRGHRYMDSGVGMAVPDAILASHHSDSNETGPDEAVGGGAYTWEPRTQPPAPLESIRTELDTSTPTPETTQTNARVRTDNHVDLPAETMKGNAGSTISDNDWATRDSPPRPSESAPYWGDLPKGTDGGVYNTVTGHGSAADDHDEHHKLQPKSAERRAVITGHVADYPRGGVYNTVAGHGSQDDEARRHSRRRSADNNDEVAPVGSGYADDAMLAAPLPDIPEEKQKITEPTTLNDSPDTVAGFLPETAVRDDARLLDAVSRDARQTHAPSEPNTTTPPRTFPLAAASVENREGRQKTTSAAKHGAPVGAAGIGAAPAATEYSADGSKGAGASHIDNHRQAAGEAYPGPSQTSPVKKTRSHEEGSPKAEKKHKILGIFHRHGHDESEKQRRKSAGDRAGHVRESVSPQPSTNRLRKLSRGEAATERKRLPSSSPTGKDEHPNHGKEKAAAGAAAGAGVLGYLHRKRNSISEGPQESGSPIRGPFSAAAGGAGPAGEAPRQIEEVSTPFEHPREPPMPLPDDHKTHVAGSAGQHDKYNVLASGTASGIMHAKPSATQGKEDTVVNEPGNYNTLASGTPSGVAASAHKPARSDGARGAADYNELSSSGTLVPSPTRRDVVASDAGDYNVLKSSGMSPAEGKPRGGSSSLVTQEPGNYNTLPSGTASGIKQHFAPSQGRSGQQTAAGNLAEPGDDKAEYNVLSSGTPSGVKVKPRSPRQRHHSTDPATHATNQSGHVQYNTLPSGTASGIHRDNDITSRAEDLKNLPIPSTATTHPLPEPEDAIPSHLKTPHQHHHPNPSQESVPGITTYAHPEPDSAMAQHHMSPEVMPKSYTASVPRSSSHDQPDAHNQGQPMQAGHYPPESTHAMIAQDTSPGPGVMMPSVYDDSAAATGSGTRDTAGGQGRYRDQYQDQNQYPASRQMAEGMSPEVMPAAYTSSVRAPTWQHNRRMADSAGLWSGKAGVGRVVHRCQHCGGENDISGYIERVLQERS